MDTIATFGVVVIKDSWVLLVRHLEKAGHLTGMYGLPAGRPGENESAEETAIRELKEETGLEVKMEDLVRLPTVQVADIQRSDGTVKRMSIECFVAWQASGELEGEKNETEPEWVSISELGNVPLLPNVMKIIEEALAI